MQTDSALAMKPPHLRGLMTTPADRTMTSRAAAICRDSLLLPAGANPCGSEHQSQRITPDRQRRIKPREDDALRARKPELQPEGERALEGGRVKVDVIEAHGRSPRWTSQRWVCRSTAAIARKNSRGKPNGSQTRRALPAPARKGGITRSVTGLARDRIAARIRNRISSSAVKVSARRSSHVCGV